MLVGARLLAADFRKILTLASICLDFYSVKYTKPCIHPLILESNPIKLVVALSFYR